MNHTAEILLSFTGRKVSKYGVFSGPNAGKCWPEKTSCLEIFHVVIILKEHYKLKIEIENGGTTYLA